MVPVRCRLPALVVVIQTLGWARPADFLEQPEMSHQLPSRRSTGAVGADGGGRWSIADQVYARVRCYLRSQPTGHRDAVLRPQEIQWGQVVEGAAEAGVPKDYVGALKGAVGPAHAILDDLVEHRPSLEHAALAHRLDPRRDGEPGDGHYRARW